MHSRTSHPSAARFLGVALVLLAASVGACTDEDPATPAGGGTPDGGTPSTSQTRKCSTNNQDNCY